MEREKPVWPPVMGRRSNDLLDRPGRQDQKSLQEGRRAETRGRDSRGHADGAVAEMIHHRGTESTETFSVSSVSLWFKRLHRST